VSQLPLSVGLAATFSFDNYVAGLNAQALAAVRALSEATGPRLLYLWGRPGTGKSHLAQAVCQRINQRGARGAFIPLNGGNAITPALLDGLEHVALVCIDDLQCVVGNDAWEKALFNLYNETEHTQTRLLLTGTMSLAAAAFSLPDLRSRLTSGLAFQLRELGDSEREAAVQLRAHERGFEIPQEVVDYLMRRYPRSMHELISLVEKLDHLTLSQHRRVTIPFVKSLLDT